MNVKQMYGLINKVGTLSGNILYKNQRFLKQFKT